MEIQYIGYDPTASLRKEIFGQETSLLDLQNKLGESNKASFDLETELLDTKLKLEESAKASFDLETKLLEKGVIE